jgi:hypothetical protein
MSTVSEIGGASSVQETTPLPRLPASAGATGAGADESLQALQKLMQQIEGAANTKAIPAHQSW